MRPDRTKPTEQGPWPTVGRLTVSEHCTQPKKKEGPFSGGRLLAFVSRSRAKCALSRGKEVRLFLFLFDTFFFPCEWLFLSRSFAVNLLGDAAEPLHSQSLDRTGTLRVKKDHTRKAQNRKEKMFPFAPATVRTEAPDRGHFDDDAHWPIEYDGGDDPVEIAAMAPQGLLEAPPAVDGYFWRGAPIDERQRAYCRCQLHVAARNKPECYENRGAALGQGRCYNPYAVCTASVGRQSECSAYYAFTPQAVRGGIPDNEVEAYARLRGLPVGPTREATVATIYDYLQSRRKWPR